jgi:hypothetical protein
MTSTHSSAPKAEDAAGGRRRRNLEYPMDQDLLKL